MTKHSTFLKLITLLAIIVLSILVGCDSSFHCESQILFESDKWKEENTVIRHQMIKDLTQHHLKTTMTRDEVETLLGKPDDTFSLSGSKENWYYSLVMVTCNHCANLTISFDDNGMVDKYFLTSP